MAYLLAYEDYTAEGVVETDLEAVAIPRVAFDELIARSAEFRRFVFTAYARRITDLFVAIQEVAFGRVDLRLRRSCWTWPMARVSSTGRIRASQRRSGRRAR